MSISLQFPVQNIHYLTLQYSVVLTPGQPPRLVMASSSKCLSDFLSSIGAKTGEKDNGEDEGEPDWLLESDEEEVRCSCQNMCH